MAVPRSLEEDGGDSAKSGAGAYDALIRLPGF